MPQMSPINWLLLFINFILIFMMFNMINFYCFTPKINKLSVKKKKLNLLNWKW